MQVHESPKQQPKASERPALSTSAAEDSKHSAVHKSASDKISFSLDCAAKVVGLLTWPVVLVIAIYMFRGPLQRAANILPQKLEQSSEFAVSGLSFKLQEKARSQGNEELARALGGLSRQSMKVLLSLGDESSLLVNPILGSSGKKKGYKLSPNIAEWKELEAKGLLKATQSLAGFETSFQSLILVGGRVSAESLSPELEKALLAERVRLTESGLQAYRIVMEVVLDAITKGQTTSPSK